MVFLYSDINLGQSKNEYYLGHPERIEYEGRLSLQEDAKIYHNEHGIFEDNPLYDEHFISIYKPSADNEK